MRAHPSSGFGRDRGHSHQSHQRHEEFRPTENHDTHRRTPLNDFFSDDRIRVAFLVLLAATIFFSKLGLNGMANFDDCFYAQKAKEMAVSGNWQVQTFNHVPQFGNAPLHIWLVAMAYQAFGVTVYAAKFPSAVMALATVLLIFFMGKFLFDSWTGFMAGVVLSTTYTFFKYARHCALDVTLAFFCTLALFAFVLAMRKNRSFLLLWGLAIGLAFLTKSALGLFPLIVTLLFIALDRQWKVLTWPAFWGGLLIQFGISGWWCWSQYQADGPKFLDEHLKGVILQKAYMGDTPPWYQHFSFIQDMVMFNWLWILPMAYGLWVLLKRVRQDHSTALFILLWALTLPVVMSVARYRMVWYLMQVFPALALAAAVALSELFSEYKRNKATRYFMALGFAVVILVNALPFPLDRDRERETRLVAPYVKHFAEKGAKVIAIHEDFYGLNNALLFFSDHAASPICKNADEVGKAFESPSPVLCVAHKGDLAEIQKNVKEWYPVKYGEDLILISNQKLDATAVKTDILN